MKQLHGILAYADSGDPNSMNLLMVLGGVFIVAATAALALMLIFIARARGHRYAELITTAAIFWALIAAGSLLYAEMAQLSWSREYTMRLDTGYLDPQDASDAPKLPWAIWAGLAVAYLAMLIGSLSTKCQPPAGG